MGPVPPHDRNLIGAAEAAQLLGISRSTLTRRVNTGRIPIVRQLPGVSGAYLFSRQVIELLAGQEAVA